ncbi:hypothetical protein Aspvir_001322 [Aspergillus viridinutans]|uniref:Uncharacterized protein n=1 Tax=Aspergillus viridinutans TaxID=75553 RepID=A0A9P3BNU4_ASPVI|nr:uncharacterized protein Aspvir_001322 [Aspergillus viridinutans]GIJ99196.1 hypothetical protein Aspvir_001322 [Aspergillus viridinutans]
MAAQAVLATESVSQPLNVSCCLQRRCTVSEGTGYCRDTSNQTCEEGAYFAGTGYPWPCPGPNNIQCCVKYTNMTNHTATSSTRASTGTATLPISSTPTSTNTNASTSTSTGSNSTQSPTPTAQPQSGNGLSSSQIGGIVGGVVAAAALGGLIAFIFWFRRRRRRLADAQQAGDQQPAGRGGEDADGGAVSTVGSAMREDEHGPEGKAAAMEMDEKEIPMLGGRMRQEMDAQGAAAVHELGASMGDSKVLGAGKPSELPGSMGRMAELPGSEVDFKR